MELSTFFVTAISSTVLYLMLQNSFKQPRKIHRKNVVITGASSGIGKETDILSQVAEECRSINKSIKVITVVGDVTDVLVQKKILSDSLAAFSSIDFLVLNAGTISVNSVETILDIENQNIQKVNEFSRKETQQNTNGSRSVKAANVDNLNSALSKIMDINFHAPVSLSSYFLPSLISSKGSIIVVSSMAGIIGAPTRSLYSASKFALNGYFHSLRMEMSRHNVNVSIICPGTVDTQLRLSAVDLKPSESKNDQDAKASSSAGMDSISGSKQGKLSPEKCAKHIINAAKFDHDLVCIPFKFKISVYLNSLFPRLVDYLAKKKYGYL
ncbi:11-beta-hydroxysteroid dehydrogenase 1B [Smittium culicis]|uniref:11-beta-hydroxysteroid dehydrogenase 1B n=1 Tax=Smittium culicis TaxID=133412 RepID=A0A1R1YL80_9FUNG|nr:11-beta-hydroxysteroid dehydrogenase 1B [Smittium culicis]